MKTLLRSIIFVALILSLAACSSGTTLTGDERDAVLAYSEPLADALFEAFNTGNYVNLSADLGEDLKAAMGEEAFTTLKSDLDTKVGSYQSREVTSVIELKEDVVVIYTAVYANAPEVTVRLVFSLAEPHQITGLWFDSPELRK